MASGALPSIEGWMGRPLWGRRAADEGRRLARGYSFRIKRISPRASQERLSGGIASSQAPYPSPLPEGHRLAHSAAPPFPTANAALVCGGSPVSAHRPLLRPKEGLRPFLWKPSRSETRAGRLPPCGGWRQDRNADCRNQRPKFRREIWLAVATP